VLLARLGIEKNRDFRDGFGSFVADKGLLHCGQVLQWSKNDPGPFLSSDVFRKVAELLSENE